MSEQKKLLSFDQALERIVAGVRFVVDGERLPLFESLNRVLAEDIPALRTQPPFRASAMDGYAVRSEDLHALPQVFRVIGESAAGRAFDGRIAAGEAVRIFTGAPVPDDADTVIIQEDVRASGASVSVEQFFPQKRHIRDAGLDFSKGQKLLTAGKQLDARRLALAAAMGADIVTVRRKPRVAILATGDELVQPGAICRPDQIFSSNSYALKGIVENAGGEAIDLGVAGDNYEALASAFAKARSFKADMLVTMGGVSVGDHDLVQPALLREGMTLDFWRVAVRPGKPLMFGHLDDMLLFGLPGNPVSAFITAILFAVPAIRAMLGAEDAGQLPVETCRLGEDLGANGDRQDHLRAILGRDTDGYLTATPLALQDSSLLSVLAEANALIVRKPDAAASMSGDPCEIIRLSRYL